MTWKSHFNQTFSQYYLFQSRLLTHIVFWLFYYLSFSLIWANQQGLYASFYLEFILLPVRIATTYMVLYWLMPRYLLRGKVLLFLAGLTGLLILCGLLQRLVIFAFYEELILRTGGDFFNFKAIVKSSILVNTTVMLAITIKFYGLYRLMHIEQNLSNQTQNNHKIEIKADRRTHLIEPENITFIEGLGNYVKINFTDGSEITTYSSLKNILHQLPTNFLRCHRSFVINTEHIESFNGENINVFNHEIPRGKEIKDEDLFKP